MPIPKKISYSHLNLLACPYQAFLRYEGALRGPTTPPLALGNAVHHALEQVHLQPKLSLEFGIESFLTEHRRIVRDEDVFITFPEIKKNESEGTEMVVKYFKLLDHNIVQQKPMEVEKEFSFPAFGIEIIGKIDKIEKHSDGLVLYDYKSGRKEPDSWHLRRNLQFTAYYEACNELYGEYPVRIYWHHLRNNKLIETTRDSWDVEQLYRIVENAIKMYDLDIRHRTYHAEVCKYCNFAGDICDDPNLEQEILDKRTA